MIAKTNSYLLNGLTASRVSIAIDVRAGLPSFSIAGLPDAVVRETRERVRAAVLNEGFEFPQRQITASIAPADQSKGWPTLDLALAAALLAASGQIDADTIENFTFAGELSLDGAVRGIRGALPIAEAAADHACSTLVLPAESAAEGAIANSVKVVPIARLGQLVTLDLLDEVAAPPPAPSEDISGPDLRDLRGHRLGIRALEIAAAGGHSVLFHGEPGCGKTMLARRLPSILPPLTSDEELEVTRIQSAAGHLGGRVRSGRRPFRAPHHSISSAGLVGGGSNPTPGEVTLAHRGVLFLDELAEFSARTLESLRQPLADGVITITRRERTHNFPANFMLTAATNPCPCGQGGQRCCCNESELLRYRRRLSGPLMDCFDMHVLVERPTAAEVEDGPIATSGAVRLRVITARERQSLRYRGMQSQCNGELDGAETRRLLAPSADARDLLAGAYRDGLLSLRGYDRTLRVARSVADLAGCDEINIEHVAEALAFSWHMNVAERAG